MTGRKTARKEPGKKPRMGTVIAVLAFLLMGVGAAAFGWFIYVKHAEIEKKIEARQKKYAAEHNYPPPPKTLIDDSVAKTVKIAAKNGWVPCPGDCLKLATPGWKHMYVEGHDPSDIWFQYQLEGGWSAYSQRHIGHIIRVTSDRAVDTGNCPICNGTGWVRKDSLK